MWQGLVALCLLLLCGAERDVLQHPLGQPIRKALLRLANDVLNQPVYVDVLS